MQAKFFVLSAIAFSFTSAATLKWQCTVEDAICDGGVYPTYDCGKKCGIGYYHSGSNAYWYLNGDPNLDCFANCCLDSGKGYCSWY